MHTFASKDWCKCLVIPQFSFSLPRDLSLITFNNRRALYHTFHQRKCGQLHDTLPVCSSRTVRMGYTATKVCMFKSVTMPDRCNYFEEEEVDLNEWMTSWLQYLLSRELKFVDLVRLWGKFVYTAQHDRVTNLFLRYLLCHAGLPWVSSIRMLGYVVFLERDDDGTYINIAYSAILRNARENLEDLEQSEIRTMMLRLPHLDMRRVSPSFRSYIEQKYLTISLV